MGSKNDDFFHLVFFGVWLSLVEYMVWDHGVQSSNLCTPTVALG